MTDGRTSVSQKDDDFFKHFSSFSKHQRGSEDYIAYNVYFAKS
jgi:hypothetical protein